MGLLSKFSFFGFPKCLKFLGQLLLILQSKNVYICARKLITTVPQNHSGFSIFIYYTRKMGQSYATWRDFWKKRKPFCFGIIVESDSGSFLEFYHRFRQIKKGRRQICMLKIGTYIYSTYVYFTTNLNIFNFRQNIILSTNKHGL